MTDDQDVQAIGIISALHEAGLLQSHAVASSSAPRIIGALAEAGLLGTVVPSMAPPPPGHQVGDIVTVEMIRMVGKYISKTGEKTFRFAHDRAQYKTVFYNFQFPPNDEEWLSEIDKIIAAPKPLYVHASVEITGVGGTELYWGKLDSLSVDSWWTPNFFG